MKVVICTLLVFQLASPGLLQKKNGGNVRKSFPNAQLQSDQFYNQASEGTTYSFQSPGATSTRDVPLTNNDQNLYRSDQPTENYQANTNTNGAGFTRRQENNDQNLYRSDQPTETYQANTHANGAGFTRNPNSFSRQKTHQTPTFDHTIIQTSHETGTNGPPQVDRAYTGVNLTGPRRTSQIPQQQSTSGTNFNDPGQTNILRNRITPFTESQATDQFPSSTFGQNEQGNTGEARTTNVNGRASGRSAGANKRGPNRRRPSRRPNPKRVNNNGNVQAVQNDVSFDSRCEFARGQFAHPDNCALFYNCWDAIVLLENCPSGLLFDDVNHYCDYPQNVNCGARTQTEPSIGTELCPTLWGLFPKDCTTFYNCIDGVATEVLCPEGLAFNQANNTCDYPEKVSGCEDILPYQCSERYGKFPKDDQNCKQFWLCVDGNARLLSCPRGKKFEPTRGDCRDEAEVQC